MQNTPKYYSNGTQSACLVGDYMFLTNPQEGFAVHGNYKTGILSLLPIEQIISIADEITKEQFEKDFLSYSDEKSVEAQQEYERVISTPIEVESTGKPTVEFYKTDNTMSCIIGDHVFLALAKEPIPGMGKVTYEDITSHDSIMNSISPIKSVVRRGKPSSREEFATMFTNTPNDQFVKEVWLRLLDNPTAETTDGDVTDIIVDEKNF